jgi:hypothetical protein
MTDSQQQEFKACMYCQHHFSNGIGDFCTLHRAAIKNYVRGTIEAYPMLCSYARAEDCCGVDAKDYVHRGTEKKPSAWHKFKQFVLELLC